MVLRLRIVPKHIGSAFLMLGGMLLFFLLQSCAPTQPKATAAQFTFEYKNKDYRIRSISSMNPNESMNQLIGDTFLATDLDKDRIIDRIILGEASLTEVQEIYEAGIEMLARENKLLERTTKVSRYIQPDYTFHLEIKSFRPHNAQPFNEFKFYDKRSLRPDIIIVIDKGADGSIDEVLKSSGTVKLEEIEEHYKHVLHEGLRSQDLIRINGSIQVRIQSGT